MNEALTGFSPKTLQGEMTETKPENTSLIYKMQLLLVEGTGYNLPFCGLAAVLC